MIVPYGPFAAELPAAHHADNGFVTAQPADSAHGRSEQIDPPLVKQIVSTDQERSEMTKTNAQQTLEKLQKQAENASGGGHLGGTYFGQEPDAKTASTVDKKGDKARPNNGRN
ncbi:hypothetical protein [Phyllobacterium phragmitis]|uniref:hypothetical protein n=1 Tax=Phyllobacterium phragmitis TaxID=2670329 RepID=UPI0038B4130D